MDPADPAFETIGGRDAREPIVFSCEHATNRLPEWTADPADAPWLADHWGWDVGAADLTRALVARVGGVAVLSRFSRLVCDPNREPADPTFVVERIDGHALSWNRGVDDAERARRAARYHEPYHAEIDRVIAARLADARPTRLCSVHSFTPSYRGDARGMEIGVLFDDHEAHAERLIERLRAAGLDAVANAPYSGYAGMIHAARRHGRAHGVVYLEIEVRQDLIDTPDRARDMADRIAPAVAAYATGAADRPPAS